MESQSSPVWSHWGSLKEDPYDGILQGRDKLLMVNRWEQRLHRADGHICGFTLWE